MKNIAQSMSPKDAAEAFFGQEDAAFSEMIERLAINDKRLVEVFKKTRDRFLSDNKA